MTNTEEKFYGNGINGTTGDYGLTPITADELADTFFNEPNPPNLDELKRRHKEQSRLMIEIWEDRLEKIALEKKSAVGEQLKELDKEASKINDALETLNRLNPELATEEAVKLKTEKTGQLIGPVSRILSASGDSAHIPYFEERLTTVGAFYVFNFYNF